MTKATQRMKILDYCKKHGSITVREAFENLYINSPTKRISELRQSGFIVDGIMETKKTASGGEVKFKRYFISEGAGQ